MIDLPIIMTKAGAVPNSPTVIRQTLTNAVAATNPGYTDELPGSLIEDIASTDVAAIAQMDSLRVELINSLSPYGANLFILSQLGQIYLGQGYMQQSPANTSVNVVFTGPAGFLIPTGFTVSDGTYQYTVQDTSVIGSSGNSPSVFCLATQPGTWGVPEGTVTQIITSVPSTISLSVTNPNDGTPSAGLQTEGEYRAQVIQAGLAMAQGMPAFLKTQLLKVSGVQARLISVLQQTNGWEVIVGGGDLYEVGAAIYNALFDVNSLIGSTMSVDGITQANPATVTTVMNHGFVTGQTGVLISGVVGMVNINSGGPYTVTVVDEKNFTLNGVNSSGYPAYVSGGVVTPNNRNVTVTLNDFPDLYQVPFVQPPQQTVTMTVTWNTTATNVVSDAAVAQEAAPALAEYINDVVVGQPLNLFVLQDVFQDAVIDILPKDLITRIVFSVNINGVSTAPTSGTGIIAGDPESYFFTAADGSQINVTRG